MEKSLFRYIWRHSRRDQILIFLVVLASLPFYFVSLDLPRRIVNEAIQGKAFDKGQTSAQFLSAAISWPDWLGGGKTELFSGFPVDRLGLLFGLSGLFLIFVLLNGWFKYYINVAKGALGERMLRRMRFELFSFMLRFRPETLRTVKSSEAATIIKDEVEPIGGFIGDAFVLPAFLGTQAATALAFILLQSVWLGLAAAAVVGLQFLFIPRLRRELLRLGKQRQLASRRLAGRVGEVVEGMEAVHVNDAARWERAEIGQRLFTLFDLRFKIYKRKFIVKFVNNLLAQMTPFFFYAFGGYFALKGRLDIGQLVAVIAAYRELPPPLKELIDWDQQRLDVQVKYDQVVQYFAADKLLPAHDETQAEEADADLAGPLVFDGVKVFDSHGAPLADVASLKLELPKRVALVSEGGAAAGTLARLLARRSDDFTGTIRIGEHDLLALPRSVVGRRMAYAGVEPILFPGSLRDNLLYGLRQRPLGEAELDAEERRRISEAKGTGNPVENAEIAWIDSARIGFPGDDELDVFLLDLLRQVGLEEDVYRFGIDGMIDPGKHPELAEKIVEARTGLREKLRQEDMADLVEPFDPERYNTQATLAENLLFGVPTSRALIGRSLATHEGFRTTLDRAGLTDSLVEMGVGIAETMTEIFRGLPPGHPLFEQFSFVDAEELEDFAAILRRHASRRGVTRADRQRLLALPLGYIEPRHRLGLLDDDLRERLVAGRAQIHAMLGKADDPGVDFYDPDRICASAPVRDNLLFGRVNQTVANAAQRVRAAGAEVVRELGLKADIERVGLDHQVGPAGRLLSAAQRASVSIVRSLVKKPDLMVVDGALAPLGAKRAHDVVALLLTFFSDRSLFVVVPGESDTAGFDVVIRFHGGVPEIETREIAGPDVLPPPPSDAPDVAEIGEEIPAEGAAATANGGGEPHAPAEAEPPDPADPSQNPVTHEPSELDRKVRVAT